MAEVVIRGPVSRVECDAVGVEGVEGEGSFGDGGGDVVVEGGEGGEEAEVGGRGVADRGCVLVHCAREGGGGGALEESAAGGCEGEDGGADALGSHYLLAAFDAPLWEAPAGRVSTRLAECCELL